jgi:mRNA-degrading endonuclease RelE of RelBE toxin-antitoxin system
MSEYRLFLEIRVFEQLRQLKSAERNRLLDAMEQIRLRPEHCSDYTETDSEGRTVAIHIAGKFAVKYWEDAADRHVKVLDLHPADRAGLS